MKKVLLLAILAVAISCSKKNTIGDQIEASVVENAFGENLGYSPISTNEVMSLTYGDFIAYLKTSFNTNESPDELKKRIDYIIESARQSDDGNTYHVFNFMKEGLMKFDSVGEPDSVYFKLYKHNYSIINPMFNNAKVNVTGYYFFDSQNNLMARASEDEYKEAKLNYIKTDTEAEIVLLYESLE